MSNLVKFSNFVLIFFQIGGLLKSGDPRQMPSIIVCLVLKPGLGLIAHFHEKSLVII